MMLRRPDWLREPLDPRVNPGLRWAPFVTWVQLAADMAAGNHFEQGQGHMYGTLPLDAWHNILARDAWSDAKIEALRGELERVERL